MKKLIIATLIFAAPVFAQNEIRDYRELKEEIIQKFNSVDGTFALALHNYRDCTPLLINEKEEFHAASTMKTPVMIEVFRQASEGLFSLDDHLEVKNEFTSIVDGSKFSMDIDVDGGESMYEFIGEEKTIYDLVYNMITVSGNLATNILIDTVKAKNVMKAMKELGADDIQVLRGVEDIKAYRKGMNNTTTAYDLMIIFKALAEERAVSETASEDMTAILLDQQFNTKIPALLPDNVKVAHKTGSISGVLHDSGIVFLPDGNKYVIVILGKEITDMKAAEQMEAEVSKLIYDFITAE